MLVSERVSLRVSLRVSVLVLRVPPRRRTEGAQCTRRSTLRCTGRVLLVILVGTVQEGEFLLGSCGFTVSVDLVRCPRRRDNNDNTCEPSSKAHALLRKKLSRSVQNDNVGLTNLCECSPVLVCSADGSDDWVDG